MSDRDLSTPTRQVFGDVPKGTECRVCGRDVEDGRAKYCSDYCRHLAQAVMSMLNWSSVRRRIIERDDHTCQVCGFDRRWIDRGRKHIRHIIFEERLPERPRGPSALKMGSGEVSDEEIEEWREKSKEWCRRRDKLKEEYNLRHIARGYPTLEVDHIEPVSEGGHPFDPGNLRTLCTDCHKEKTAREAAERAEQRTPSRPDIEAELADFVADGGRTLVADRCSEEGGDE